MALLFMEGFDGYNTHTEAAQRRDVTIRGNAPASWGLIQTGRIDGKSAEFGYLANYRYKLGSVSTSTMWVNLAIYTPSPSTVLRDQFFAVLDSTGDEIWSLDYDHITKEVRFLRGGYYSGGAVVLGTTSSVLSNTTFHSIGAEVFVDDTVGTVKVWFDGNLEINLTSQDTKFATDSTTQFILYGSSANSSHDIRLDDIIFGDNSGSDLTAHPGDCHIEMILPDADGTTNDWTAVGAGTTNADRVDEFPSDDDTTYVHSTTALDKDLYNFAALTGTISDVYAVQVHLRARKEGTGYREVNATMRSNVTEVDGPNLNLAVTYLWFTYLQENDPNGGGAWTVSAVNAMQAGIELKV